MKYSNWIGALLAVAFIGICYMPWIYISSIGKAVEGMNSNGTIFGKPGLFNIIMCVPAIIFFLLPKIWAKRTNLFFTALNFAWALKNYILLTICRQGECPDKQAGLFLMMVCAIGMFLMALFPDIKLNEDKRG